MKFGCIIHWLGKKRSLLLWKPIRFVCTLADPRFATYAHIGNFRAFLFEDLLKRWLEYRGFEVLHVMNLTDVDDKTIRGLRRSRSCSQSSLNFTWKLSLRMFPPVNIEPANFYPRATDHIPNGRYDKDVIGQGLRLSSWRWLHLLSVSRFSDYGKLSEVKVEDLKAGVRVKHWWIRRRKRCRTLRCGRLRVPEDGDVFWNTELGKGRPGWHIECSAMSMKYLKSFDIHCGGVDNDFPHHENEIAQSQASTGKKFVNYWLHNEDCSLKKRMAKRFGNFYACETYWIKDTTRRQSVICSSSIIVSSSTSHLKLCEASKAPLTGLTT